MLDSSALVAIYALRDEDGNVRYVGKAVKPEARYKSHLRETRRKTPLYAWIAALRSAGKAPVLSILEWCEEPAWQEREQHWIVHHGGPSLLNVAPGGDQPYCPPETRAANGRRNAARLHASRTGEGRKIWALKQKIGVALRKGWMSEAGKAKLRLAAQKAPHLFGEYASL